ncbi:MAG: lysostaphin resistance A-like protein [Lachnospiraceae bacterium]
MGNTTGRGRREQILHVLVPVFAFTLLFEILGTLFSVLLGMLSGSQNTTLFVFATRHAQSLQAVGNAVACAVSCAFFLPSARREIQSFLQSRQSPKMTGAWETAVHHVPGGAQGALFFLLASALFLSAGINILLSLTGLTELAGTASDMTQNTLSDPAYPVLAVLLYGFLTPAAEELIFRGLAFLRLRTAFAGKEEHRRTLFASLLRASGTIPAAIFSAVLFAIYHANLPQGIYAFVLGTLFALSVEITGRFSTAVFLHSASNLLILLFSLTGLYNELVTPIWCACFLLPGLLFSALLVFFLQGGPRRR